jgi:hypothetical protein
MPSFERSTPNPMALDASRRWCTIIPDRFWKRCSKMQESKRSPRILGLTWGNLEIEGLGAFKDAKLFPGGACEWDWRETGTQHAPGIQPRDVEELLSRGSTVVILTKGMVGRLRVDPATLDMLADRGVTAHVLPTEDAVRLFNELRETTPVGGLFHTTC